MPMLSERDDKVWFPDFTLHYFKLIHLIEFNKKIYLEVK